MNNKKFIIYFIGAAVCTLALSFLLFQCDLSGSDNDVIRHYQMDKFETKVPSSTVLVVGDSSAGNAIDSIYFQELTGQPTENVALTGSFGLPGTLEMMQAAVEKNPRLKNIIIIQTLDIWRRPFAKEGVFELERGKHLGFWSPQFSRNPYIEYAEYASQLKNIFRALRSLVQTTPLARFIPADAQIVRINAESDYLQQEALTYSNSGKILKGDEQLSAIIDPKNLEVLYRIDVWCGEQHLNCLYLHGPLHETVYQNSLFEVKEINAALRGAKYIQMFPQVLTFKNDKIGDSINHVALPFKKEATKEYYKMVKTYLH